MARRRHPRAGAALLSAAAIVGTGALAAGFGSAAGAAAQRDAAALSAAIAARASSTTSTDAVVISNFMFHSMKITVGPGATVSVTNDDAVTHTLTAMQGQFNTGNIAPGHTKTFHAPEKKGTYHYLCAIHQFMTGTIVVK